MKRITNYDIPTNSVFLLLNIMDFPADPLYRAAQKTLHRSVFFDGSILLLHHTQIGIR